MALNLSKSVNYRVSVVAILLFPRRAAGQGTVFLAFGSG
jgi:hypothetical protein